MLNRVTLTGIDNQTSIEDLIELQKEFNFVEFGVLVSEKNTNKDINNRYPNFETLKKLENKNLNLSCHLCGKLARNVVKKNDWNSVYIFLGSYFSLFQRCQLNIIGTTKYAINMTFPEDKQIIIQLKNDKILYEKYKDMKNVVGFQDNSGGKGIFENMWMCSDKYFGYAGGLNLENVENVIQELNKINTNNFWIDMESSLRINDWFSIDRCYQILKICSNYIV